MSWYIFQGKQLFDLKVSLLGGGQLFIKKEFAPLGSHFFLYEYAPFWKGLVVQGAKKKSGKKVTVHHGGLSKHLKSRRGHKKITAPDKREHLMIIRDNLF